MKTPDTINGKTPEEIKKGLECGFCYECPYGDDELRTVEECVRQVYDDVLAYIQQLESRLAQAVRERDAAVCDVKLGTACDTCWYNENQMLSKPCAACDGGLPMWKWRGVCPENTKEDA